MRHSIWYLLIPALTGCVAFSTSTKPNVKTPVLVELFTSEGCSSCPPADAALRRLAEEQPADGAEIVAMSEHVDYWNSLGWKDPFSSSQFSRRQTEYGQALGLHNIYTPQMIIDGEVELIGSNFRQAVLAVSRAAGKHKEPAIIQRTAESDGRLRFHVQMDPVAEAADVYLAVTEDNLTANVIRGENKGRKLTHIAVVRKLSVIGQAVPGGGFSADPVIDLRNEWKAGDLKIVVFAQSRKNRSILALASSEL